MNYVPEHRIKSRDVQPEDLKRVLSDAAEMMELCIKPPKDRYKAYAIAHSQVTDSDPLRFFVTNQQKIIINPVITRHTKVPVDGTEGCTTYTKDRPSAIKQRFHKCEVSYFTVDFGNNPVMREEAGAISGLVSKIFQHEIDHMDAIYIYDEQSI